MQLPASPLTGKAEVSLVRSISAAHLEREWRETFNIDIRSELNGANVIREWRCNESHLRFFTPSNCVGTAELYQQLSKFTWYYMQDKWEYAKALHLLQRETRLLEIGCGGGHFLEKTHNMGLKVHGLELAPPDETGFDADGWCISRESVQQHAEQHPCEYDVVCAFQVLEHVPDPASFLFSCANLLKPGAQLIIATPNANSFLKHAYNILDCPPHHMSGWSEESYRFLESMLPLTLETVLYEPLADYHLDYFMNTYNARFPGRNDLRGAWTRGAFGKLCKLLLRGGVRHICRGQSMLAVLRKPR